MQHDRTDFSLLVHAVHCTVGSQAQQMCLHVCVVPPASQPTWLPVRLPGCLSVCLPAVCNCAYVTVQCDIDD